MSISLKSSLSVASALLASIVLAGCATGLQPPTPQQEKAARTRADHELLAAKFGRQAAAARRVAAEHREMAKSFAALKALGRDGAYPDMQEHCASIVARNDALAAQYIDASVAHRHLGAAADR